MIVHGLGGLYFVSLRFVLCCPCEEQHTHRETAQTMNTHRGKQKHKTQMMKG